MEMTEGRMRAIRRATQTTGTVRAHGLKGRATRAMQPTDPRWAPLREHFNELLGLGEVRATKFIKKIVDGMQNTTTKDDDDGSVFLPATNGIRPMYYRYMKDLGYSAAPNADGTVELTWVGEGSGATKDGFEEEGDGELGVLEVPQPFVHLSTYRRIWKREYPQLKVSRPSEDLCALCVMFRNRHQHLARHTTNQPGAHLNCPEDDKLFLDNPDSDEEESDEDDDEDINPKQVLAEGNTNPTSNEPPAAPVGQSDARTENPEAMTESAPVDHTPTEEEASTMAHELKNPADQRREEMLLRAALHVTMAKAQRELYVLAVQNAVNDELLFKPHSTKSYCCVVDYGQNMDLPVFHKEQPGPAYYYSPFTVNNCGVVNHSHKYPNREVKAHLHVYVYHEGVR